MHEFEDVLTTPGHLISLAARRFARLSEARLKPLGFGVGHLPVLVSLWGGRSSTQRDLAAFAGIEQPPMAQMLGRMERNGLIQKTPNPDDGRSHLIELTSLAQKRIPAAVEVLREGSREALRGFTKHEHAALISLLQRLTENVDHAIEAGLATGSQDKTRL